MSYWVEHEIIGFCGCLSLPRCPGVYVICFNGKPVYVGQSIDLAGRLSSYKFRYGYAKNIHTPWGSIPDDIRVTAKAKQSRRLGDWAMWEIRLIKRLSPEYNSHRVTRRRAA